MNAVEDGGAAIRCVLGVTVTLVLLASSCSNSGGADTPTTSVAVAVSTTTVGVVVAYEDGQQGSCRVLEEKYCSLGEMVYFENGTPSVAFSLPEGTPLFAFGEGNAVAINVNPLDSGNYDPDKAYRAVHIMSASAEGTRNVLVLFANAAGEPDVHLANVAKGDIIGYLTTETLSVLPGGLEIAGYNVLVQFFDDMIEPDKSAFEKSFGLTP